MVWVHQNVDKTLKMENPTHKFPRPAVTVDAVTIRWEKNNGLALLIGKRNEEPFKGQWALPGAFLLEGKETPEETLSRLLKEKTGTIPKNITLACVQGDLKRDPRGHVLSIGYLTICPFPAVDPTPGGNFSSTIWHPLLVPLPKMAFDHQKIVREATQKLHPIRFTENLAFNLLPREFTISWLRDLCRDIAPKDQLHLTDPRNFHTTFKKMEKAGIVEKTPEKLSGAHRPAQLYRRTFTPFQN